MNQAQSDALFALFLRKGNYHDNSTGGHERVRRFSDTSPRHLFVTSSRMTHASLSLNESLADNQVMLDAGRRSSHALPRTTLVIAASIQQACD
jgi:hypothetical protein